MIRLGVIGMSEGNGHPYSWSAICNGYDAEAMENCGFPGIPRYLAKRGWPGDRLPDVSVTHVWTQEPERARHIAKAALIDRVVSDPRDMIGLIDGLLLARDDAENHPSFAEAFLRAGIPVYVDKNAALSTDEFDRIAAMQTKPRTLFTGSALRFAEELSFDRWARNSLGELRHIFAQTPKGWDRYAVHIIEPVLAIAGDDDAIVNEKGWSHGGARGLHVGFESGLQAHFAALGDVACPISLRLVGDKGSRDLVFRDSFTCFRTALSEFVAGIREGASRCDLAFARKAVSMIESGRQ